MIRTLLVRSEKGGFPNLEAVMVNNDAEISRAESGSDALSKITDQFYHLIVVDEKLPDVTGLELAEKLILKNPMSNVALVSSLSQEDFHEASEGLGLLMQLSPQPDSTEAEILLKHLKSILQATGVTT
ncbi:MAG: response regulator [Desulfosalsimonadaceae bacterium]